MLSQNASENAKLSSMLDCVLNDQPTSLQQLRDLMGGAIVLSGNTLTLSFKLKIPQGSADKPVTAVSIATETLTKLGFDVTRNESLALTTDASLEFTLNVDLTAATRADGNTYVKNVLPKRYR